MNKNLKPNLQQLLKLVGNPKIYATQNKTGQWYPAKNGDNYLPLTPAVIKAHIEKKITVGTYVVNAANKARTLVFDFDDGDLEKAKATKWQLVDLGIPERGIGIEFSGKKGYHVWVVFAGYTDAVNLRRIGSAVSGITGFDSEIFPKQNEAKITGSLVKLPGGIHRVTGNENNFIDQIPQPLSIQVLNSALEGIPELPTSSGEVVAPFPCIQRIADGPPKGGRNNSLYHYAVMLRKAGVPDGVVRTAIYDAAAKAENPEEITDDELEGLLETSIDGGPLCQSLPEEVKCDPDECVCRKTKGLYVKTGQLKHAGKGEMVVLQVVGRYGKTIELAHPDTSDAKGVVK